MPKVIVDGLSPLLLLDWVPGFVMYDSIFARHCKFTSTLACHINLGNYSSMSVSFFGTLSQQGLQC
jgi:hypothetical protein